MRIDNTNTLPRPPLPTLPRIVVSVLATYALVSGLSTLVGWVFGLPRLTDWLNSGISMFSNAALASACAGASLLLLLRPWPGAMRLVAFAGCAVALLGGATLCEHIFSIDLRIDSVLISHPWGSKAAITPGRMGPPASLSFLLIGTALFLAAGKSRARRVIPALAIAVIAISLLAVIGYVFKANPLFATARLTAIALQTATILLALGIAILAVAPDLEPVATLCRDSAASILLRRALPFLLLLPIILGRLFIVGRETAVVDRGMGTAMLVLGLIICFSLLIWWCAADVATHEARSITAERELERKNAQLTGFLETAAVGLHRVGPDGIILWANPAEMQMLGYSPDEYIGHHISEFHADEPVVCDILNRLTSGQKLYGYEARLRCKDGSIKHVLIDSSALFENDRFIHTQCFTRDVTDRKAAEENAARLAAIVEHSDDAIFSMDLQGFIQSWNRGAEGLYGYSAKEAIGRSIAILFPDGHEAEQPRIIERIREGQSIENYETVRRHKNGNILHVSLTVSPVKDRSGTVIGISKVARDITEKVRAREILEQTVAQRTASLEQALAQMEDFTYSISHDLRAPARVIHGMARAALEDYGNEMPLEARDLISRIHSSSEKMEHLVRDIPDYSRLSRAEITLKPVELDRLVPSIIRDHPNMQPPKAQIKIPDPLGPVLAHEPSLSQAITNLLANAIKFVRPGTVPDIQLRTERINGSVRLWITDNGIGVKPEYQSKLFRLFERVHLSSGYEGTGIGLAIVRKAAERMGGRAGIVSDGSSGSSFWIDLPALNA